jgi:hypothetical protein
MISSTICAPGALPPTAHLKVLVGSAAALLGAAVVDVASAQESAATAPAAVSAPEPAPPSERSLEGTTVVPRTPPNAGGADAEVAQVRLVAQLTADGQHIDQGLVWRVYSGPEEQSGKPKLLSTYRDASPTLKLKPGDYIVNAAFGRAHLTRTISVKPGAGAPAVEPFVLNAGGLRVAAIVHGSPAPQNAVSYSIYSDRDQSDNRKLILASVKPGVIIRLNAGIYHVVSTYGDANAVVRSDVTVEAGKLTETTIAHSAAKVTFKLVRRPGGEAVPDTQWSIQSAGGETIRESVGALPTHILAPGSYTVVAKSQGAVYQRAFSVADGDITQVEVVTK